MELFDYLMTKKGHNTHRDLFSYLLGKPNQLPSEYQRLEYIESTGTQYIDTGRKSTLNTKFDFNYMSNRVDGSEFQNIFGSQTMPQQDIRKNRIYILIGSDERIQLQFPHDGNNVLYMLDNGTFTAQTNVTAYNYIKISNNDKVHIVYDLPNRMVTVNEYTSISTSTYELTSSDYNVLIFNRNEETIPTTNLATGRLYNFKWYESGKLVMNFIPCMRKSDNEVGLYDTIGKQFYINQGTGKFAYKGYTFVEYIESTGAQYIDTNRVPSNNEDIKIKCFINATGSHPIYGAYNNASQSRRHIWSGPSTTSKIDLGWGVASLSPVNVDYSKVLNISAHFQARNQKLTINGSSNSSNSNANTNPNLTAYLFGRHNNYGKEIGILMRLYSCKIYDNGVIVINFIPCIRNSDNAIGLYDMVNDTFYGNAGTGTFVIPNNVQLNSVQSLNTSLLSQNINDIQNEEETNIDGIQEEPNLDDLNEIEENLEYEEL